MVFLLHVLDNIKYVIIIKIFCVSHYQNPVPIWYTFKNSKLLFTRPPSWSKSIQMFPVESNQHKVSNIFCNVVNYVTYPLWIHVLSLFMFYEISLIDISVYFVEITVFFVKLQLIWLCQIHYCLGSLFVFTLLMLWLSFYGQWRVIGPFHYWLFSSFNVEPGIYLSYIVSFEFSDL